MKAAIFRGHRQSQLTRVGVDSRMERPKKGHLEVRKDPRKSRWFRAPNRTNKQQIWTIRNLHTQALRRHVLRRVLSVPSQADS